MSRIAKKGITIPPKTEVALASGVVTVKGPKGTLTHSFPETLSLETKDGTVMIKNVGEEIENESLWGTYTSHIKNMIIGVTGGYTKKLIIEGVGYKADIKGKELVMALGFSHPVKVLVPEGLTVTTEKGTVTIVGTDKDKTGQFAAYIRSLKKPEPYKGKGFRYSDEVIRRKQGKKSV